MIPYEIDPSLYTAEPEPPVLDGGFSPPPHEHAAGPDGDFAAAAQAPARPAAGSSS